MNISSINGNVSGTSVGTSSRPATSEAPPTELRQLITRQASSAIEVQSEQSVSQTQKVEANRQQLEEAVKQVNDFVKPINNSIQFSLDDDTGKTIVKVIDLATKDVIRQFPSEEMLSIAKALDKMQGLLIQQKA